MADIMSDVSPEGLRAAVETSLIATWIALASASPTMSITEEPDIIRYESGVAFPVLNGVLRTRLQPDESESRIDQTLDHFASRALPMTWWIGPGAEPDDLAARLNSRGFSELRRIGLAADMWTMTATIGRPVGLSIEVVEDAEVYRECQHVLNVASAIPDFAAEAMYDLVCASGFGPESPFRHYIGYKGGRAISTAMLSLAGGVAGIYNSGTLPEERAQGIEMAMTLSGLLDARDMEYRVGVLQTTRLGYNMFRHLGLEETGEIEQWIWAPPEEPPEPQP